MPSYLSTVGLGPGTRFMPPEDPMWEPSLLAMAPGQLASMLNARPLSRASSLPQGSGGRAQDLCPLKIQCGREPARDGAGSACINTECQLASTGFCVVCYLKASASGTSTSHVTPGSSTGTSTTCAPANNTLAPRSPVNAISFGPNPRPNPTGCPYSPARTGTLMPSVRIPATTCSMLDGRMKGMSPSTISQPSRSGQAWTPAAMLSPRPGESSSTKSQP